MISTTVSTATPPTRTYFITLTQTLTAVDTRTIIRTSTRETTLTTFYTLKQADVICFSKRQNCVSHIVGVIDRASRYVHVMVYSFTSDQIAEALIRAKNRGVEVKVVIESQQANVRGSEYQRLVEAGIEVRLDGNTALMHHKVAILDGVIVVTGSYNWSAAAEDENDENLVIVEDVSIASAYEVEFQRVWGLGRLSTTTITTAQNCHPSYPDVCIPPPPPDLDCSDIPYRNFRVLPPDPHGFDRDGDGIGCET